MLFSSMIFIWVFLPVVIIINYSINLIFIKSKARIRIKNTFLLISSLFFYAWGGVYFSLIMIASILINYIGGMIISKIPKKRKISRNLLLSLFIVLNLLILIYFKYFNMIIVIIEQISATHINNISLLNDIFSMKRTGVLNLKNVVLPIGISFFTFQAMSYVIDVYKGDAKVQKSIFDFGLYVALFPQLIAGPIVKYSDIAEQINNREENSDKFLNGVKRFCYGLGKKVILANTFASIVDGIWGLELTKIGCALAIFGALAYTMQIYYDFSGYSDMAIGLGKIFGFDFKENFNYPYMSNSVIDFWRRWHISLSSWFKNYVYFPLGGSKCGKFRTYLNILIVFLLTGIWHGANWTFIAWGIIYAILQIIERIFLGKLLSINPIKILNWIYTMFVVVILWVLFRADNIYDAITYLSQFLVMKSSYSVFTYLSMKVIFVSVFAVLCMGVLQKIFGNAYNLIRNETAVCVIDFVIQLLIFAYSIVLIINGTYNPFIYFQF